MSTEPKKRGLFILLEGLDRSGKTSQISLLQTHLASNSQPCTPYRFPNRTTVIGKMIDGYLKSEEDLNDATVHLLFSANRWECADSIMSTLNSGTHVICDRYAYSGVSFTSAKQKEHLDLDWCIKPDVGLPRPDIVLFIDVSEETQNSRGGFGNERYEKVELQREVRKQFMELKAIDSAKYGFDWVMIDGNNSMDNVTEQIKVAVERVGAEINRSEEVRRLWGEGECVL